MRTGLILYGSTYNQGNNLPIPYKGGVYYVRAEAMMGLTLCRVLDLAKPQPNETVLNSVWAFDTEQEDLDNANKRIRELEDRIATITRELESKSEKTP